MTIIRATITVADLFSFFYRGVLSIPVILADALQSYDLAVYSHLIKMKSTFNRAVPMGYDQILTLDLWKVYTTYHPLGGRYFVFCFGPSQCAWSEIKTQETSSSERIIRGVKRSGPDPSTAPYAI